MLNTTSSDDQQRLYDIFSQIYIGIMLTVKFYRLEMILLINIEYLSIYLSIYLYIYIYMYIKHGLMK